MRPIFTTPGCPQKVTDFYKQLYKESCQHPDVFWDAQARQFLTWRSEWSRVQDTSFSVENLKIRWFEGGTLNVAENCVDRHAALTPEKVALIWEPDDPKLAPQTLTYQHLYQQVCQTAQMLLKLGIKVGDCVTLYMPMIPEAVIAMLACARIGAVHSVVFAGFSSKSLQGRLLDSQSRFLITADEGLRAGKTIPIKQNVEEAVSGTLVEKVLVFKRTGNTIPWNKSRDVWWHDLAKEVSTHHEAQAFDAEHPLFILYTSGSTGQPKGLLHTSAGYLLYTAITFQYVFDYRADDVYWCTADIGWITGHSYLVYGPLACGATVLLFESTPTYPDASRWWNVVDKYKVSLFYTSPTAIRMLMREGEGFLENSSRKSLRILGSVGEPMNPEAWLWYYHSVGKSNCPVIDTWWQTETGGHLITPLPQHIPLKPGSVTLPFFGIQPALLNPRGQEIKTNNVEGALCIQNSWPGQARTIWKDHARFVETYFKPYPGFYFSGDAAKRDEDGYYWIEGRMDDVINVSGHRLSTAEIEAALNSHPFVTESAVVGYPHPIKGQAIYAYVMTFPDVLVEGSEGDTLREVLSQEIRKLIGAIAIPEKIQFVGDLPKTRSGKIMRRILRKIAAGEIEGPSDFTKLGDISTLLNPEELENLVKGRQ